ncbi:MAG: DinB family protein [Bacteroidota bacterium]
MQQTTRRPRPEEYGQYYNTYISKVKKDNCFEALTKGKDDAIAFYENIPADKWGYKYGPDKWTIKEVLLHIIDSERVFAYRALRIARSDQTPLPGFDQNIYVPNSRANERTPESLIDEYRAVREATLALYRYLDDAALSRIGTASDFPASPLALGFIIAGHEIHHVGILEERYL